MRRARPGLSLAGAVQQRAKLPESFDVYGEQNLILRFRGTLRTE